MLFFLTAQLGRFMMTFFNRSSRRVQRGVFIAFRQPVKVRQLLTLFPFDFTEVNEN